MDNKPTVKYIVAEYGDLFALQKEYGLSKGPIRSPLRVGIETIAELFMQQVKLPLIQEVINLVPEGHGAAEWSNPVELTKENFRKTYSEIAEEQRVEFEKRIMSDVFKGSVDTEDGSKKEDSSNLLDNEDDEKDKIPLVNENALESLKDEKGEPVNLPEQKIENASAEEIKDEDPKEDVKDEEPVKDTEKPEKSSNKKTKANH